MSGGSGALRLADDSVTLGSVSAFPSLSVFVCVCVSLNPSAALNMRPCTSVSACFCARLRLSVSVDAAYYWFAGAALLGCIWSPDTIWDQKKGGEKKEKERSKEKEE